MNEIIYNDILKISKMLDLRNFNKTFKKPNIKDINVKDNVETTSIQCMFDNLPLYDKTGKVIIYSLSCSCPKCSFKC